MSGIGAFELDASEARQLANEFGTPLYVVDADSFEANIAAYLDAQSGPYKTQLYYASKANPLPVLMHLAAKQGLGIDVASQGEFMAALHGGVAASQCNFHGNFKSDAELKFAIEHGIGEITVDEPQEVERIADLCAKHDFACPHLMLRLLPGVEPKTHPHIRTGQYDSKFGIPILGEIARDTVKRCLTLGLPLQGFHAHVGSQLFDSDAQTASAATLAEFAVEMIGQLGFYASKLNLGGGLGVRYVESQPEVDVRAYCARVQEAAAQVFLAHGLEVPTLAQEPGRALVANATVALYSVGSVNEIPIKDGEPLVYVSIDGGLSDNPRPALYQAPYTVKVVREGHHESRNVCATIAGKHCETDTMFRQATVPCGLRRDDLIQVLCSGAYQTSMASNYNRLLRPAVVLRKSDGSACVIQRRESYEELLARDAKPEVHHG